MESEFSTSVRWFAGSAIATIVVLSFLLPAISDARSYRWYGNRNGPRENSAAATTSPQLPEFDDDEPSDSGDDGEDKSATTTVDDVGNTASSTSTSTPSGNENSDEDSDSDDVDEDDTQNNDDNVSEWWKNWVSILEQRKKEREEREQEQEKERRERRDDRAVDEDNTEEDNQEKNEEEDSDPDPQDEGDTDTAVASVYDQDEPPHSVAASIASIGLRSANSAAGKLRGVIFGNSTYQTYGMTPTSTGLMLTSATILLVIGLLLLTGRVIVQGWHLLPRKIGSEAVSQTV